MTRVQLKAGDVRVVRIDALDDEGRGRAALEGDLDLCVRGAFVGDVVDAEVERTFPASGVAQARAVRFVERGPLHVPRSCAHASPCPACPLHGLEPHVALDLKVARIRAALDAAGLHAGIERPEESRAPRQKVKLVVERGRVGLYVPHTHSIVDADRCAYHHPAIERALAALRPHLAPPVKAVIARVFAEGVGVVLVCSEPLRGDAFRAVSALANAPMGPPALVSLAVRVTTSGGNSLVGGSIDRCVGPQLLTPLDGGPPTSVDAFCQPDPLLAERMTEVVAELVVRKGERFVDLYSGTGAFARRMLDAGAARVVAVEREHENTQSLALIPGVQALALSVEDALPTVAALHAAQPFSGLIADPPRKGLGAVAASLAALRIPRVALIACDPDAGARDARAFHDAGYTLASVRPFDLFPGTPDIEAVFMLERTLDHS